jgi:pyruvate dehydrogenase E1 component alpha subunit
VKTPSDAISLLEAMMLIRAYELNNCAAAAAHKAPGTCTSVGQEASAVGVVRALRPEDFILTNHRSAGHLIARGAEPKRMLAEVMGRSTGYCKGKSGNLHISVKELGVVLTSTIVGAELSLAPGVALALVQQKRSGLVACLFGDGAACEGTFHESLNLAAVWRLPVLYVCENNQWQASVARRETMLTENLSSRAAAYGIEGRTVDGNDVQAVHRAALEATAWVRERRQPYLLETFTYRARGHYEPDDQSYVDPEELKAWKAKDPIDREQKRLREAGVLNDDVLHGIEQRVAAVIAEAVKFASESPFPAPSELTTDLYA